MRPKFDSWHGCYIIRDVSVCFLVQNSLTICLATKMLIHLMVYPKFNSSMCLDLLSGLLSLLKSGRIYNCLRVLIILKKIPVSNYYNFI